VKRDKILVIGLGRFGSGIAVRLSLSGEDVIAIDKDDDSFRKLADTYSGYQLVGDVLDVDILENAGIRQAKTVIATTDDDNVNIMVAEIASRIYGVQEVFLRLVDQDKAVLIESQNVHPIFPYLLSMAEFDRIRGPKGGESR